MTGDDRTKQSILMLERLFKEYIGWPDYEVVLRRSYESFLRPGGVVVDVGAHSGTHLEHFLRIVGNTGRVIAFEPLPDLHAGLVERFRPDGVTLAVHQMAIGRTRIPSANFVRAEGSLPESGLRERVYNAPSTVSPRGITVEVETLDRVIQREQPSRIDYVKMDIEGGELDAIEGGMETIARFRPIISVEITCRCGR
jgi:FkbM family methyltransferase